MCPAPLLGEREESFRVMHAIPPCTQPLTHVLAQVRVLTRDPASAKSKLPYPGVEIYGQKGWAGAIEGSTGVVNLAGEVGVQDEFPSPHCFLSSILSLLFSAPFPSPMESHLSIPCNHRCSADRHPMDPGSQEADHGIEGGNDQGPRGEIRHQTLRWL